MATRKTNGKRTSSSRNGKKDAISLLKADHKVVKDLLQKLMTSSERSSKELDSILSQVQREVKTHSMIEEEIFYPAFKDSLRKKDDQKLYFEAKEEHHVVDMVLDETGQPAENEEALAAKCKVLKELVVQHIKEEERDMFPVAKKVMDKELLQDLGLRMEERKEQIMSEIA